MGELAAARQRTSESVIMFANRIKRIAIELKEAAKRDKAADNRFAQKVEKDKLKFFLRGVDWEIKRRMGEPTAFQQAIEKAIEIEREVIDLEKSEPDRRTKTYQENYKLKSQASEVNIVQTKPLEICQFCDRKNHIAKNCRFLKATQLQNAQHAQPQQATWASPTTAQARVSAPALNSLVSAQQATPNIIQNQYSSRSRRPAVAQSNQTNNFIKHCNYCKKEGHWENECEILERKNRERAQREAGNANGPVAQGATWGQSETARPIRSNASQN